METIILNIILCVAFGIFFLMPHMKSRRAMLLANVAANLMFMIYYGGMAAYAGMLAMVVATLSSLMQATIPEEKMEETTKMRFGIAFVMVVASAFVSYRQISDLLPLIGTTITRFGEACKSTQMIRYTVAVPLLLWIGYNYVEGFYIALWADLIVLASYSYGIYREERARRLAVVPVPAE